MGRDRLPKLSKIDAVDLLLLEGKFPGMTGDGCLRTQGVVSLRLDEVGAVLYEWKQLRPEEPARCHEPPLGLRFYRDTQILFESSLCWKCDNIYLYDPSAGKRELYGVDMGSEPAQQLLQDLMTIRDRRDR